MPPIPASKEVNGTAPTVTAAEDKKSRRDRKAFVEVSSLEVSRIYPFLTALTRSRKKKIGVLIKRATKQANTKALNHDSVTFESGISIQLAAAPNKKLLIKNTTKDQNKPFEIFILLK